MQVKLRSYIQFRCAVKYRNRAHKTLSHQSHGFMSS
uniref:Uncharacterized protein n=1 Tax=Setaria italica TaxID=4555 RepID=K3Y3X6_SETIT